MRTRPARLARPLVAVAAAAMLTACGLPSALGGGGSEPGDSHDTPRQPPTELHPGLRDCAPQGSDDALSLADSDLEAATWSTPAGFSDVSSHYHEDNPVEDIGWIWVAAPDSLPKRTLDVISVNYYTGVAWNEHTDNCDAVPLEAVEERLARYRAQIGAKELSEAEMTEINGYPAIKQDLRLKDYDYEGYWLFSTSQLLHVYCQWETPQMESEIREGCGDLVSSLKIP